MLLRTVFTSLLAVALAGPAAQSPENVQSHVLVVDDIAKARSAFPDADIIPLARSSQSRGVTQYTLGNRVNGDRLVGYNSGNNDWATIHDVQLRTQYPASGQGAVLTHVAIIINSSSNVGQAYVVSGGIGQRFVVIIVEATNTLWFDYESQFYGA